MPSNRRGQPEAEKRAEIIASARTLFIDEGYDATSMTRLAKHAGITPNTIYWYFKDKDQVLLAVLDELLVEYLREYQTVAREPLAQQLYWLVMTLRSVQSLVATVHVRSAIVPAIDEWHQRFHQQFEALLGAQLPPADSPAIRAAEIRIASYTLEGLLFHPLDDEATLTTCQLLAAHHQRTP